MESASVLDTCIGRAGADPDQLRAAAATYDTVWRPEVQAISWISERMLFENRRHMLWANLTTSLGINVIGQAKSSTRSWSQVRRAAQRFGPLWK
jgi:hypothetical protein